MELNNNTIDARPLLHVLPADGDEGAAAKTGSNNNFSKDDLLGRTKSIDVHSSRPSLMLTTHATGHLVLWNINTSNDNDNGDHQQEIHEIRRHQFPYAIRTAKFVERNQLQWIIAGSDGGDITVVHSETLQVIASWKAHEDYIRSLAVHPTLPSFLSASDDKTIKLWDWSKGVQHMATSPPLTTYGNHSHYVMQVKINPHDTSAFASASMDKTVRIWTQVTVWQNSGILSNDTLDSSMLAKTTAVRVFKGHQRGVNCVAYDPSPHTSFLLSGADDRCIILWNHTVR